MVVSEMWTELPEGHAARSTDLPWYNKTFDPHVLKPPMRHLLERWAHIPPDKVEDHIYKVREEAWKVFPWPSIGQFWFIEQGLLHHPEYKTVLAQMQDPDADPTPMLLDLGTCLGQDLRTLANDGVPLDRLLGADIFPDFEKAGYLFFNDGDRFSHLNFVTADILSDDPRDALVVRRGLFTVIHISMFLHVFDLAKQERACVNILKLLTGPGAMVIGTQSGCFDAGELVLHPPLCDESTTKTVWRHNRETLREMWERAAVLCGVHVEIQVQYDEEELKERARRTEVEGTGWEKKERFFSDDRDVNILFSVRSV